MPVVAPKVVDSLPGFVRPLGKAGHRYAGPHTPLHQYSQIRCPGIVANQLWLILPTPSRKRDNRSVSLISPSSREGSEFSAYNQLDALTTYLLWLRVAHFAGFFTPEEYSREQEMVQQLLQRELEKPGRDHLQAFLDEWARLRRYYR